MVDERQWLDFYNELYEEYAIVRDEDGDRMWEEYSPFGGGFQIWGKVVQVRIQRFERSLDPWHVEIQSETQIHCLIERFWDDKDAWEAVRSRLAEVGLDQL